MLRAGLQKTSLVDYPETLAAVVFLPLCNFRCPWCHNSSLVAPTPAIWETLLPIETINNIVRKRRTVLNGVVITGGEPTLSRELPELISLYKGMGYKVKLDTNGSNPDVLAKLFIQEATCPDYIALDLKLAPHRYLELGGDEGAIKKSADLIQKSGVDHEFRTIVLPQGTLSEGDIEALADLVDEKSQWVFSPFKPGNCLDPVWDSFSSPTVEDVEAIAETARRLGKTVELRGIKK